MFAVAACLLLCLLSLQVDALIYTDAKCLSGYEWMFSSIGQSPCDVAAELASVCVGGQFNLAPIGTGYVYLGPPTSSANACRCSSVYYSLLSACAFCQGGNYLQWSTYSTNCTTVYVTVYNQPIPVGVKVPAYAYQNVSVSDTFDLNAAQSINGPESSRVPPTGTQTLSPSSTADAGGTGSTANNTPAIVGGVVGGVIGLGLIAALIIFLLLRSRRDKKLEDFNSEHASKIRTSAFFTSPPDSPGKVSDAHDQRLGSYTPSEPHLLDPNRQASPPMNQVVVPNFTGTSAQSRPQTVQHHNPDGRAHYTGMPEV